MESRSHRQETQMGAVVAALEAERFPMSKEELYYSVGDMEVQVAEGQLVPVRDLLDRVDQSRFETADDAVTAIESSFAHGDLVARQAAASMAEVRGPAERQPDGDVSEESRGRS